MAATSVRSRLAAALPDAAPDVLSAGASLWLLLVAGVAAPAAALAGGSRPPATAAGATQLLLVALAPAALLYVPYAVRREVRPAVKSDRAAAAVAAGAAVAALAAVAGGAVALRTAGDPPAAGLPALVLVLPAFGVWRHRRGTVADPGAWAARHCPARTDLLRPWRLAADPRKAGNAALVGVNALVLAAAGNLAWRLVANGGGDWRFGAVVALAYGAWFVGGALLVRAGLWEPWRRL